MKENLDPLHIYVTFTGKKFVSLQKCLTAQICDHLSIFEYCHTPISSMKGRKSAGQKVSVEKI